MGLRDPRKLITPVAWCI